MSDAVSSGSVAMPSFSAVGTGDRPNLYVLSKVSKIFVGSDGKPSGGIDIGQLTLRRGGIIAILGLSGTGKSTLLNLIGGIMPVGGRRRLLLSDKVDDGTTLHFHPPSASDGAPLDLVNRKHRRRALGSFGYVFQNPNLLHNATGTLNISIAFRARRERRTVEGLVAEAHGWRLAPDKLAKRVRQLSGGEKQRTAIGRGLVRNPDVLLADEPTANLDPRNGMRLMGTIRRWQIADPLRTVIWVTHNILEASIFADEIVLLQPGANDGDAGRLADGATWPVVNSRDPQRLASMLFRGVQIPEARPDVVHSIKQLAAHFTDNRNAAEHAEATRIAALIGDTAASVGMVAASASLPTLPEAIMVAPGALALVPLTETSGTPPIGASSGTPPTTVMRPPVGRSPRGAIGPRRTVRRIGLSELVSAPRADRLPIPGWFARAIGSFRPPSDASNPTVWQRLGSMPFVASACLGLTCLLGSAAARESATIDAALMAAACLLALSLSRAAWRTFANALWGLFAFANWFQVFIFGVIAALLFGLVLARDAVTASFDASLRSLDLSHIVVAYRAKKDEQTTGLSPDIVRRHDTELQARLRPALAGLDDTLERRWLREPLALAASEVAQHARDFGHTVWPGKIAAQSEPSTSPNRAQRLTFGRYVQQQQEVRVPIAALPQGPTDAPNKACESPAAGTPPVTYPNATILTMSPDEPAVEQMHYRGGASLAALLPLPAPPTDVRQQLDPAPDNGLHGVIVTTRLLDLLRQEAGTKDKPAPADSPLPTHLCLYGAPHWALVRIAAIVDRLPKEDLIQTVHLMAPEALFFDQYARREQPVDVPGYDSEAIYFADPRLVDTYLTFFRSMPDQGTVLPDAFERIRKLLETSKALTDVVDSIMWLLLGFALLLVGLLTFFFIRQNEKSLCVMRAFGIRLHHVVGLVTLQLLIVWGVTLTISVLVVTLGGGSFVRQLFIERMQLSPDALAGSVGAWYIQMLLMTGAVALAAAGASALWWASTPSVGDRLKELE